MSNIIGLFWRKDDHRGAYWVMLLAGIAAFLAAFTLSIEKLELLKNADAVLSCSLNAVLNCASVMKTWQSSLFGFPNPYLGIMGFAIVIAVAMGGLLRVKFNRAYLTTAQVFYGLGLLFSYWLFFQSVYVIQILCPWCLVVTATTTLIFESLLRINLHDNNFGLDKKKDAAVHKFLDHQYDILITAGWLVFLAVLVILKFGSSLFGA